MKASDFMTTVKEDEKKLRLLGERYFKEYLFYKHTAQQLREEEKTSSHYANGAEIEISVTPFAVDWIEQHPFGKILSYSYEKGYTTEKIAELLHCEPSTIVRNKKKLLILFARYVMEYKKLRKKKERHHE